MEAENSHSLLPASWRIRKVDGINPFKFVSLRTKSSDFWGQNRIKVPAQEERENLPFLCSFVPVEFLTD